MNGNDKTIEDWRRRIDAIDRKLVELLNERAGCAMAIGELKRVLGTPVYQPEREEEILKNVERMNGGPLEDTAIRRLFERVIDEARSLERAAVRKQAAPETSGAPSEGHLDWAIAALDRERQEKKMVVVMQEHASQEQIQRVIDRLVSNGFDVHRSTGESHTVLGAVGVHPDYDPHDIEVLEGVREVVRITKPQKPRSQAAHPVEVSPFHRVAVIGTGLVGGSFALALRGHFREVSVVGLDRAPVVERAMTRGIVPEAAADIADAVRGADLVYIALPIASAIDMLPAIAASAGADALVTDACSTKAVVCEAARKCFRGGARFLGGHPMAGLESSGAENANGDLFRDSPYALIGAEDESDPRVAAFARVLRAVGAKPVWCDAETHDWAVGIVSHLPQLLSVALARMVGEETDETGLPVSLAGRGLRDSLRLAGSSYDIWRDVCLTNTQNIARALDRLGQAVEHLRTHLTSRELEAEFAGANELYKTLKELK